MADTVTIRGKAPGEADFFYTLDRVLGGLLAALKAGRIDEAVDVYSRCREDIGFQLISRAQGDPELFKQAANLFFRARDFARAAYCCEHLEEHVKAASLYERADDWLQAANMYAAAGERTKAAEMFEKAGNLAEAARLYRDGGDHLRAAACFERARKLFDAATCYQQAGKLEKAIEVLNLVDEDSPDRKVANKVIKELMGQANLKRAPTTTMPAAKITELEFPMVQPPNTDPNAGPSSSQPGSPAVPEPILMGGGQLPESGKGLVTVMEGFEKLKDLPLFAELSLSDLKEIYTHVEVQNVNPGDALIRAGQPATSLYVVLSGQLEVRTPAGQAVAQLNVGQHAGEMSVIDDGPASVDVVVAAPGRVLRLDKQEFRHLLTTRDALALRVYREVAKVLTARLRDTTARLNG